MAATCILQRGRSSPCAPASWKAQLPFRSSVCRGNQLGSGRCYPSSRVFAGGKLAPARRQLAAHRDEAAEENTDEDAAHSASDAAKQQSNEDRSAEAQPDGQAESADWRAFRSRLIAREGHDEAQQRSDQPRGLQQMGEVQWAHRLATPEPGCLLVARDPDLGLFNRSVILMLEHTDKLGSVGIILNIPTPATVGAVCRLPAIAGVFGEHRLFVGGPLRTSTMHCLHDRSDLEGVTEVLPGVYAGGILDAAEKALSGELTASTFRMLMGVTGWGAYQLSNEILQQSWWIVAASSNTIQDFVKAPVGEASNEAVRDNMWRAIVDLAQIKMD